MICKQVNYNHWTNSIYLGSPHDHVNHSNKSFIWSICYFCPVVTKIRMHLQIFIKVCNANFRTDQSCSFELCRGQTDTQTEGWMARGKDTAKIIVTFFSCFVNMTIHVCISSKKRVCWWCDHYMIRFKKVCIYIAST